MGNKTLFQTVNDLSNYIYEWIKNRGFRFYPEEEVVAEKNNLFTTVLPIGAYSVSNVNRPDNIEEQYYYPIPHGTLEEQKTYNGTLFSMQFGDKSLELFIQANGIISLRKYEINNFGPWFDVNDYYEPPQDLYNSSEWQQGIIQALRRIGIGYTLQDGFDLNFATPWSEEEEGSSIEESPVCLETGIYWLSSSYSYKNTPTGAQGGLLFYLADFHSEAMAQFRRYQILIDYNSLTVFIRNYQGTTNPEKTGLWSNWVALNDLSDLSLAKLTARLNPISKDSLLKILEGNIFNNQFIANYRIAGPVTNSTANDNFEDMEEGTELKYLFASVRDWHGVAIVPIEPNTSYWIGLENLIYEHQPAWEAEDTTTHFSYFSLATTTKILNMGEQFDGAIFRKQPNKPIVGHIITTGENDKYLYIQTCQTVEENPYLEIVKITNMDYFNENLQLNNINKYSYNFSNRKEADNGFYILANEATDEQNVQDLFLSNINSTGFLLTEPNSYNEVKYTLSDSIDLTKNSTISNLISKIDSKITQSLSVTIEGDDKNLFDGSFIGPEKGYRIGGASISALSRASGGSSNLPNTIALIPVSVGQKYHLHSSLVSLEANSSYFKIGISNLSKDEIIQFINAKKGDLPLGHVFQDNNSSSRFTDFYLNIRDSYWPRPTASSWGDVIELVDQATLVIQISGAYNTPYLHVQQIEEFPKDGIVNVDLKTPDGMVKQYLYKGSELNQKYTSYGKIYIRDGRTTHMVSHDYNELRGTNVWRWYKQTIDDATIFNDSDCEGPVYVCALEGDNILSPKDYIGGYHGSEIMENVALFIDGQPIPLNQKQSYNICQDVKIIVESKGYEADSHLLQVKSYGTTDENGLSITFLDDTTWHKIQLGTTVIANNQTIIGTISSNGKHYALLNHLKTQCLFHRIKTLSFNTNKINIKNYWKFIGEDGKYIMKNGLYTGLFSVPFSYFNGITSNFSNRFYPALPDDKDDYKDTPIILEENANLTEATFLGKSFTITLRNIRGGHDNYYGQIKNMAYSGDGKRYKVYLTDGTMTGVGSSAFNKEKICCYLGVPSQDHPEYIQEFSGEFEIITTAPNGFKLHLDGTVEEV